MNDPRKRRIVLGVTGSISAAKAQSIALALQHRDFEVRLAMTYSATKVIGEAALRAVVHTAPFVDMWAARGDEGGETHIEWAAWADAMLIAPATASCIHDLWAGAFNSSVTLVAGTLPFTRIFFAPAMAKEMWDQPSVQRNVRELTNWGATFLGPVLGTVASGRQGMRLKEPRDLAEELDRLIHAPH